MEIDLPAGSTQTNSGNGRASQTNLAGNTTENDSEKASEGCDLRRACTLNGVAALYGTGVALVNRRRCRGGDRKKGDERKGSEFVEEHCKGQTRMARLELW